MATLRVPDTGLLLEGPGSSSAASLPEQAFAISLSNSVIEDMIQCVQNGEDIQLSLGSTPAFLYGSHIHQISPTSESFGYDLFLTKPKESPKVATQLPNPIMSVFKRPKGYPLYPPTVRIERAGQQAKTTAPKQTKSAASSSQDSDTEALKNSLLQAANQRHQSVMLDALPTTKKGAKAAKSKLLSSMASKGPSPSRSLPTSPALNAVASPSLGPTKSVTQQAHERAKEQRVMIVHELAVQEQPFSYLFDKWTGEEDDLMSALNKVGDFNGDSQKWALARTKWKELDVWQYDYETPEDRQRAIENAIVKFDRLRLPESAPEWQKLLPKNERGKGKSLSRVQAAIAAGTTGAAPKIKVQNADADANDSDSSRKAKSTPSAEAMTRSVSQPLPAKTKKATESQSQVKRIMSGAKKSATPAKSSPMGRSSSARPATNGKFKSEEYVIDSSSSGDEAPLVTTTTASSTATKAKPAPAKARDTITAVPAAKPKPKAAAAVTKEPAAKPQASTAAKRARPVDDSDSSSSSGTPLSKRIKPKEMIRPPIVKAAKHRTSEPSTASGMRNGTSTNSFKAKNTSPTKSSPLASSPPTNASDLEQESDREREREREKDRERERQREREREREKEKEKEKEREKAKERERERERERAAAAAAAAAAPPTPRKEKRKLAAASGEAAEPEKSKRQRTLDKDIMNKAVQFRGFYTKYEALHNEIAALENPPEEKLTDLLDMRDRLKQWKQEIYREVDGY